MALGALIGAGGGILGGLASGLLSGRINARASAKAARRQRKVLQNQYRWAVHDLTQAGLNPILAAGGGIHGGSAQAAALGTGAPHMDVMGSARTGALMAQEKKNLKKAHEHMDVEMGKKTQETELAREKQHTEASHRRLMRQQEGLTLTQARESAERTELYSAQRAEVRAREIGQAVNNLLLSTQVPGALIEKGIDSGVEGEITRRVKRWLGGAQLFVGGVGGRVPRAAKSVGGKKKGKPTKRYRMDDLR